MKPNYEYSLSLIIISSVKEVMFELALVCLFSFVSRI